MGESNVVIDLTEPSPLAAGTSPRPETSLPEIRCGALSSVTNATHQSGEVPRDLVGKQGLGLRTAGALDRWLRAVIATLRAADTDASAILLVRGTENRFIQIWAGCYGELVGEVVSNQFLSGEEPWSADQHQRLVDLGWRPPDGSVSWAESPNSSLLNYRVSWPGDCDRETADAAASELFTETFRDLVGVVSRDQIEATIPPMAIPLW